MSDRAAWKIGLLASILFAAATGFLIANVVVAFVAAVSVGAVCGWWIVATIQHKRRRDPAAGKSEESGSAVLEWMLGMGVMILPVTCMLSMTVWPSRLNAASAAAYQAAKAAAEARDPAAGEDLGRQRAGEVLSNHGVDPAGATVSFSTGDPQRGEAIQATVTIDLPALRFPGLGSWDAAAMSRSATVDVPTYGSLG